MVVAIAADPIGNTLKDESATLERLEWFEDILEFEIISRVVGPEFFGENAVRTEDDDESLATRDGGRGEPEAGEVENVGSGGGGDAEVAEEFAARGIGSHSRISRRSAKAQRRQSTAIIQ